MIIFLCIYSILITTILIILIVYAIPNILKKYEKLESESESKNIWTYNFKQTVDFLNKKIKEIDSKGSFASDDEVGIFFTELKNMQELLNKNFTIEQTNEQNN
jgi:phage pi2 protein 07